MGLFEPFKVRGVSLKNRVVVSPMSQYISTEGAANDWHLVHLGRFALGGAGLVFTEATGVEDRGRRTHGDLGLWCDEHIEPLERITRFIKAEGSVPGIQLGHAGRKASERRPWHNQTPVDEDDVKERGEAPWDTIGPSALTYGDDWHVPKEMSLDDIRTVIASFRDAARRADEAGFEVIDVYAAHGFLIHQFYSPIANVRDDAYGGDFDGRIRFALEVAEAIREVWPDDKALFYRLSAKDWIDGGWDVADTVKLASRLKDCGVDVIDCSSGGIGGAVRPDRLPVGPGFQVPFAEEVRRDADIATMGVGFIWDPAEANAYIEDGKADLIALGREMLDDPNWALHAADALGRDENYSMWREQFGWWLSRRRRLVDKFGMR